MFIITCYSCKPELSCEGCIGNNKAPTAVAGQDQVITLPPDTVVLDGSSSSDPDGKISAWQWTKLACPASCTIVQKDNVKANITGLIQGVYTFELKVTDDGGLYARDTVVITVDDIVTANQRPVACAGADQTIILPTDSTTLDGSCSADSDSNIATTQWMQLTGTASNFTDKRVFTQHVTGLQQGIYQFELTVTDAGGLFSKDTVQVTVLPSYAIHPTEQRSQYNLHQSHQSQHHGQI